MSRNADGVGVTFSGKKRYEGVMGSTLLALQGGGCGSNSQGKKHWVPGPGLALGTGNT